MSLSSGCSLPAGDAINSYQNGFDIIVQLRLDPDREKDRVANTMISIVFGETMVAGG